MIMMTKEEAQALAKFERDYVAKPVRGTRGKYWGVWCTSSDHWVEFDQVTIDAAVNLADSGF